MPGPLTLELGQRKRRKRPPVEGNGMRLPRFAIPRLVAPNMPNGHNTLTLDLWLEVKVINDRGRPIADERCQLCLADGSIMEQKTGADGLVRFNDIPLFLDQNYPWEDVFQPAFSLPDILE